MKKRMQIGLEGWSTLHFQCGLSKGHRTVLREKHQHVLEEREWGLVLDLSIAQDALKHLNTLTPKWRSLNDPHNSGKMNYVEVESISLPDWEGEEARELSDEQAAGCITLVDLNGDVAKLYLQPNEKLEALADMVSLCFPKVMA